MNVGIACGGTGGHVFPGLATAAALKARGHHVVLWLGARDVENVSTDNWDGPVVSVPATGFPAGFSVRSVAVPLRLLVAFLKCRRLMKEHLPDVLLAMGSYACVGPALAARALGIPVVLHEGNAVCGRANSFLSWFASSAAVAFRSASGTLRHSNATFTGFPVRIDMETSFEKDVLRSGAFTVVVMGGSQGAHRLNEIVLSALCRLHETGLPVQVVHLAGSKDEAAVRRAYKNIGVPHLVFAFLKDVGKAYNAADFIISRSGAAACAEIAVYAVPALLVPLASATREHQMKNARVLEAAGGARVVAEKDLSDEWLAWYVEKCYRSPESLNEMKRALKAIAVPEAADRLANLVERTAKH